MEQTQENARKSWMGILAKAPKGQIPTLLSQVSEPPKFDWLRPPEVGSVMIQGRMGGSGSAFNFGEMTVTRCSLKLADGTVGHGYVQGRSKDDAKAAAIVDALLQTAQSTVMQREIIDPLKAAQEEARATKARKAAATKVDFFTMARGED